MSYLSGVGYAATRLRSPGSQDLPFHLVYVGRKKSGYAATQL